MNKFDLVKWLLALSPSCPVRSNEPFARFSDAAHAFYCFVDGNTKNIDRGVFPSYYEFMDNVIHDLAYDRCGNYPDVFEKLSDRYCVGAKAVSVPNEYAAAAKAGAMEYIEKCNLLESANAETQKILANAVFAGNSTTNRYINYFHTRKCGRSEKFLYIALLNLGFMQGVRYERSRRNGKEIESWGAAYTGRRHKKRYNVYSKAE